MTAALLGSAPDQTADPVLETVAAIYRDAGIVPGAARSAVAPLFALTREAGLRVDEVENLTHQTAATHLAAAYGQPLIVADDETSPLAGFLYANAAGGWILVNQGDPLARRRFTIAHELGHYLLDFLPLLRRFQAVGDADLAEFAEVIRRPDDSSDETLPPGERLLFDDAVSDVLAVHGTANGSDSPMEAIDCEQRADQFAAALLMPEVVCRHLMQEHADRCGGRREVLARRLASELLVSVEAMKRRLADLALA